ncbi:MAG: glycosyltransferase family 2 protein [Bacteroidota bacterium]
MLKPPKVSIITVCYNAENFLERTIQSVIAQTYPNIEYIVVDGASKDNTVALIKQYEKHITRWISEKDQSHFDAMNKGLRLATGDYIWYMNAGDCIYEASTLENIVRQSTNEDFIYGDTVIVTEEGMQRDWHKTKPSDKKLSYKSFINGMIICHHSMMVKRSKAVEYALEPWKVSNDIDWTIRVLKNCNTYLDTDIIWCKYLEGGISAKNRMQSVKERFDIARKHFGLVPTLFEQVKILVQMMNRGRLS